MWRRVLVVASLFLLALWVWRANAHAQADCGGYTCVDVSDFASGLNGWTPGLYTSLTLTNSLTFTGGGIFGWGGWTSTANGVLIVRNTVSPDAPPTSWPDPEFSKTVSLTPGTYRLMYRVSYAWSPKVRIEADNAHGIVITPALPRCEYTSPGRRFNQCEEAAFTVDRTTNVKFTLSFPELLPEPLDPNLAAFDYIWIVRTSTYYPTPNPATPTRPFVSTPLPQATPRCQPRATPTPSYYGTPTPTPAGDDMQYLERFNTNDWSRLWQPSNAYVWRTSPNRGVDSQGFGASVGITFAPASQTPDSAPALIYSLSSSRTVYLDGWVYAASIPSGTIARVRVWRFDGGSWSVVSEHNASSGTWHPFGATIPAPFTAIAISAVRTDGNTTDYLNVDDLLLYNNLAYRPYCDGSFPPGPGGSTDPYNPSGSTGWVIPYPQDKSCPPPVNVPNNFWGPILANLTVWVDTLFAESPEQEPGRIPEGVRMVLTPFMIAMTLAAVFLNLQTFVWAVGIRVTVTGFLLARAIWLFIVRTIKG
ncbi:MAG: hypothetical protein NZM11_00715 [Anaerolineales bacterium]|nr:hypothetical protein [Anaerolineales bacterium]